MIFDKQTLLAGSIGIDGTRYGQAITATALSTNVLDLRNAAAPAVVDDGLAGDLYLYIAVLQAFNNLSSLVVTLETASDSSLASAPVVVLSKTIALAGLTAGAQILQLPLPSADWKRYLGLRFAVVGTPPSQGSIWAALTPAPQRNRLYAGGFTVDA